MRHTLVQLLTPLNENAARLRRQQPLHRHLERTRRIRIRHGRALVRPGARPTMAFGAMVSVVTGGIGTSAWLGGGVGLALKSAVWPTGRALGRISFPA